MFFLLPIYYINKFKLFNIQKLLLLMKYKISEIISMYMIRSNSYYNSYLITLVIIINIIYIHRVIKIIIYIISRLMAINHVQQKCYMILCLKHCFSNQEQLIRIIYYTFEFRWRSIKIHFSRNIYFLIVNKLLFILYIIINITVNHNIHNMRL